MVGAVGVAAAAPAAEGLDSQVQSEELEEVGQQPVSAEVGGALLSPFGRRQVHAAHRGVVSVEKLVK